MTKRRAGEIVLLCIFVFSGIINILLFKIIREQGSGTNLEAELWADVESTQDKRLECLRILDGLEKKTGVKADSL